MKHILTLFTAAVMALQINAQDLPKPSPLAKVSQTVGLTEITVEYSRPGIKGREIWGELVPYEELWRAGANKATKLTVSNRIMINGMELPAGEYSIFMLPRNDAPFEVRINRETELWGTSDYKDEMEILRFDADMRESQCINERMEFRFVQVDISTAELVLDWAGKQIVMMIEADPSEQVMENITVALEEAEEDEKWRVYRNAAGYAKDVNLTKQGLMWIDKSLELKETWYGYWLKGSLLAQSKKYQAAIEAASKAISLGKKEAQDSENGFSYEERINADIKAWKALK